MGLATADGCLRGGVRAIWSRARGRRALAIGRDLLPHLWTAEDGTFGHPVWRRLAQVGRRR
jgi:hypothetical protein